jgi:hypothetical protein
MHIPRRMPKLMPWRSKIYVLETFMNGAAPTSRKCRFIGTFACSLQASAGMLAFPQPYHLWHDVGRNLHQLKLLNATRRQRSTVSQYCWKQVPNYFIEWGIEPREFPQDTLGDARMHPRCHSPAVVSKNSGCQSQNPSTCPSHRIYRNQNDR